MRCKAQVDDSFDSYPNWSNRLVMNKTNAMKHALWVLLKRESPYFREFATRDSSGNILFPWDAEYDIETKILTSNHSSGFGANLSSLLGPLIYLARGNIFPGEIATAGGFKNFCDQTSLRPLAQFFSKVNLLQTHHDLALLGKYVYYVNYFGRFRNLHFDKLLGTVLSVYFRPLQTLVDETERFFVDRNVDPSNCLSVFIRGTDGVKGDVDAMCTLAQKIVLRNRGMTVLLHTDDSSVAQRALFKMSDLRVIVCDLLPLKPSNWDQTLLQPGLGSSEAGRLALITLLIMGKSKNLIVGSGQFSLWSVLLRGNHRGVFQFVAGGQQENALYVRLFYWLVKICRPELISLQ